MASNLQDPAHLYPLYVLLFAMPGVPSIYYGSEWGLRAERSPHSDAALRPALDLAALQQSGPQPALPELIARLARARQKTPALRSGGYTQLHVASEQLAFLREMEGSRAVVAVNASPQAAALALPVPLPDGTCLTDALNGEEFVVHGGSLNIQLPPNWGRILRA